MIYHIADVAEWNSAKLSGRYEPESLEIEGFIHCCTQEQFAQVSNFYFKGREDILALEIDEERLGDNFKWEDVGNNKFPHIYGPLEIHLVTRIASIAVNKDGIFEFPFAALLH